MSRNGIAGTKDYSPGKYPPRRGWIVVGTNPGNGYVHGGYTTDQLRRCPVCGRQAVFEEDCRNATPTGERARVFIGICPTCELRTREPGTLREAVTQWQMRQFSPDSLLHCYRPKPDKFDTWACALMCESAAKHAYEDLQLFVELMMNTPEDHEDFSKYKTEVGRIEDFFRRSPLAFALDPEAVASKLRRDLWPELTPKERLKIPLKMTQMYKGKEIAEKCIAERNSKRQQSVEDTQPEETPGSILKRIRKQSTQRKT